MPRNISFYLSFSSVGAVRVSKEMAAAATVSANQRCFKASCPLGIKAYQDSTRAPIKILLLCLVQLRWMIRCFRAAIFEQLGESRLEGAVTTDITGKKEAFAVRLDKEALDAIKKSRLHQKAATTIFFESNGGRTKTEATLSEVRLAVADPDMDIGNVETVLDALSESCYYLAAEKNNKYRFSILPNLNKLLADRRANVKPDRIEETVKGEIKEIFNAGLSVERCYYPEKSNQIPDRPALSVIIVSPDQVTDENKVKQTVDQMTKEYGTSARTFKSALIWCIPDKSDTIAEEARKYLAGRISRMKTGFTTRRHTETSITNKP